MSDFGRSVNFCPPAAKKGLCFRYRPAIGRYRHRLPLSASARYRHISGTFGFQSTATYRFTDNLLAGIAYLAIASSRKSGLATVRFHDMLQLRLTYQLN